MNENVILAYQFISYFPDNVADVQPAPVINIQNYKLMFSIYCRQTLHFVKTESLVKYGVRSPKFIWAPCAQPYSLAETPRNLPPPPAFGLIYEGAVDQPRVKTDDISLWPPMDGIYWKGPLFLLSSFFGSK
jgi:hypothetical protein